jgi:phage tail sheath protein FI
MPVAVSYPGVYIEEIPSGVRTITGVATSIAAFVGWAPKGPTDRAELVLSWSDFERKFGGLDARGLLGYAVYHFFANGGQRAYIVRLVAGAAFGKVTLGELVITAKDPGKWADDYAVVTKKRTDLRPDEPQRFQLKIVNIKLDKKGIPVEVFDNLSMDRNDPRFVENVLKNESARVTATVAAAAPGTPARPPADTVMEEGAVPEIARLKDATDGSVLTPNEGAFETALRPVDGKGGIYHLDRIDLFNLLCVPGQTNEPVLSDLQAFCRDRRAFLIVDCKKDADFDELSPPFDPEEPSIGLNSSLTGDNAINAAFYFPWVKAPDPLQQNRPGEFPPCGFVAGLYARTDASRGVWKAPAGIDASLTGVLGVKETLTDNENGVLNPKAINCIRTLPIYGTVLWGARTLQGNDERGSEWKYIPVRRTALFLEESLFRALKWVVFEPNDEPLWSQIRLNVGAFMHNLFRQGAFQGTTPRDAYFVKCDKETTTQNDINLGIVNIIVGFAPLKPAEFVIIKLQQIAGQIEV